MARIVNEIRRGNWLDLYGTHLQATGISDAYIVFEEPNYDVVNPNDVKGIELTPEWLERFPLKGERVFESVYEYTTTDKYADQVRIQTNGEIYIFMGYKDGVEIKYVHQLQNIYYALTGRELELKK